MRKILLIIKREYLSRLFRPAFIIVSILGPLIFTLSLIIPAWVSQFEDSSVKRIAVVDSSHIFQDRLINTNHIKFEYLENAKIGDVKKNFSEKGYWGVLYISHVITYTPSGIILFSDRQPNMALKLHIKNSIEREIEKQKLLAHKIHDIDNILRSVDTEINLRTIKLSDEGNETESDTRLASIVAWICGFLIYFFIFFFGSQVMRGVIEEKTNRIVEVIISSVRPLQLMWGKICGIGLLGLTQFAIWCLLSYSIIFIAQKTFFPELSMTPTEIAISQDIMNKDYQSIMENTNKIPETEAVAEMEDLMAALKKVNFGFIILAFVFFFIGGYLLYGSLFAAIGSAGDSDTDVQQFMLPVTVPLIVSLMIMTSTVNDPESALSVFASIFPFTSPIVMMARIPYGVPVGEFILSMLLLVITILLTVWLAGKIYRTGILMYGKKIRYKELLKWMRYKN